MFIAEGVRTVEELLRSPLTPHGLLAAPQLTETLRGAELLADAHRRGLPVEEVSAREFATAAETDSPQGILAIAAIPERSLADVPETDPMRLLVLDAVQDPGNVGTILRTAAALGASATFALPGTVDLWNAKVVRSGMGAHFHHLCLGGTWDDLDRFRRERSMALWAADATGDPIGDLHPPSRLGLVLGNEGSGLTSMSRARADRLVALPITAAVESLNVAVAAGIFLFQLRR